MNFELFYEVRFDQHKNRKYLSTARSGEGERQEEIQQLCRQRSLSCPFSIECHCSSSENYHIKKTMQTKQLSIHRVKAFSLPNLLKHSISLPKPGNNRAFAAKMHSFFVLILPSNLTTPHSVTCLPCYFAMPSIQFLRSVAAIVGIEMRVMINISLH